MEDVVWLIPALPLAGFLVILVFGGNDIPGVMMAGGMRSYLNRFAVAPGRSTAVFTTNDSGYALARDLEATGVAVAAVIDSRADAQFVWSGNARIIKGAVVSDARGGKALSAIRVTASNGASARASW